MSRTVVSEVRGPADVPPDATAVCLAIASLAALAAATSDWIVEAMAVGLRVVAMLTPVASAETVKLTPGTTPLNVLVLLVIVYLPAPVPTLTLASAPCATTPVANDSPLTVNADAAPEVVEVSWSR